MALNTLDSIQFSPEFFRLEIPLMALTTDLGRKIVSLTSINNPSLQDALQKINTLLLPQRLKDPAFKQLLLSDLYNQLENLNDTINVRATLKSLYRFGLVHSGQQIDYKGTSAQIVFDHQMSEVRLQFLNH